MTREQATRSRVRSILQSRSYLEADQDVDFLNRAEGVIEQEDLGLFWFAETARDTWDGIVRWHINNPMSLGNSTERSGLTSLSGAKP